MNPPSAPPPTDASPRLGVVVVNYNAGPLLTEAVGALLSASFDLEVFVSDNGSTDDSLGLLRARHGGDPRLLVVENGANLGFARGNNRVLARARAPYVLLLNPDCIVHPETLARLIAFLDATPDAGMAGCIVRNPDGSEQQASRRRIPDPWVGLVRFLPLAARWPSLAEKRLNLTDEPLPNQPVQVEALSGSFMCVRRSAMEEVGPLDEGYFLHCEDLDWFVRFARAGWKIYLLPDLSVVHHQGTCSRGRRLFVEWHKHLGMLRFFRKFQASDYSPPFRLLVAAGIIARFSALAAVEGVRRCAAGLGAVLRRRRA